MTTCSVDRDAALRRALACIGLTLCLLWLPATAAADCAPLPQARNPAAQLKYPTGLLWRIVAPDGAENFLLGTMHLADPAVLNVIESAADELDGSNLFVMEVLFDFNVMSTLQTAMFFSDGQTLDGLVGEELFQRTVALLQAYGLPESLARGMKPWAAFMTLSLPAGEAGLPLDVQLMGRAQANGIAVRGIETVQEQIAVFETLSANDQIDMLREIVCHHDVFQTEIREMVEHYVARDLQGLMTLSMKYVDEARSAFMDALLWQRNDRMTARIEPLLREGGAFVAVGALHLAGPRGLLEQLENRGFSVQVVD